MVQRSALLALVFIAAAPVYGQDRARTLHDTHCLTCHGTQVYTRKDRLAGSYDQIRAQVDRWQANATLKWTADDIDLVATYLARQFYKTPCPMDC